jgi:hypothetical protein
MHQLLISGGVKVIAGGSQENLKSLAYGRYYPEDILLQWFLNLRTEPVIGA